MDPIDVILHRREELGLSARQVAGLRQLQSEHLRVALTQDLEIRLAELDLAEVVGRDADSEKIEPALSRCQALRTKHELDQIKLLGRAKALLSEDQRDTLSAALNVESFVSVSREKQSSSDGLRERIASAISERLKDTRVVEVETAEAILNRLLYWLKLFGVFVVAPIAVVLGGIGVNSAVALRAAQKEAATMQIQGNELMTKYSTLKEQLKTLDALSAEVKGIVRKSQELFALSPDGKLALFVDDRSGRIVDLTTGKIIATRPAVTGGGPVISARFLADGQKCLILRESTAELWDWKTGVYNVQTQDAIAAVRG